MIKLVSVAPPFFLVAWLTSFQSDPYGGSGAFYGIQKSFLVAEKINLKVKFHEISEIIRK